MITPEGHQPSGARRAPASTETSPSTGASRWRQSLRRRWPLFGLAALVLVTSVAWALTRGDGAAAASATAEGARAAAPDSVVRLDTAAQRLAGVELAQVATSAMSELTANGTITYDANHVSIVVPRTEGRVVAVRADLGDAVNAGAVLATIASPEIGQIHGDLERARSSVEIAKRNFEREQRLFKEQITPEKEMLDAEGAYRAATADYNSAVARLRAIGAQDGSGGSYGITTPVAGTVVERNATPGQVIGPQSTLFVVADLRHVWITVDVYERDLPRVHRGARVSVVPTAFAAERFPGRVTFAGGIVDSASRTFKVRVEVENLGRRLRPGMFAQVHIETPVERSTSAVLTVPELAVQDLDGKSVVFVARATPGEYVVRPVTLGARVGDGRVAVSAGLTAGERVVVQGAFQLKAELTKASFGEEE